MSIVPDRSGTYDGSLVWDETIGDWVISNGSGGSRYQNVLVAVGQNDTGEGVIYFKDL